MGPIDVACAPQRMIIRIDCYEQYAQDIEKQHHGTAIETLVGFWNCGN